MERAPGRPSAQTSTLKPSGTLSLSTGSIFAALPVTSIANGCRDDFSCSALRPCCHEGGAAGACACAAWAISTQASAELRETRGRNDGDDMEYPPFPGCCCVRGGAAMQSAGRSGIIATLDPGRNRIREPRFLRRDSEQTMAHRITASCPAALLALGAGAFALPAGAQTGPGQRESSGTSSIVVTATRSERNSFELPVSIDRIDAHAILEVKPMFILSACCSWF